MALMKERSAGKPLDSAHPYTRFEPKEQEIHIVLDNYATHKHEAVLGWIERQKRIFLHFIPTSASWVNLVERFFATLTQKQIRRTSETTSAS